MQLALLDPSPARLKGFGVGEPEPEGDLRTPADAAFLELLRVECQPVALEETDGGQIVPAEFGVQGLRRPAEELRQTLNAPVE